MSEPQTYIVTRDLKAAVAGRETDVLDGLSIDWRRCTGSNHIRCPYPEHGSDGENWRWDPKKAKAFCSCQSGHADSILDVVMKCEALDVEAAKIRTAELIGRSDLIKTKGGKGGQRMDAVSLMNPPDTAADTKLARAYLGHRLRIDPADVLMPSTAVVGWTALTYWDSPAKQGGKPVEVGRFPAVAFATVAADGGMHCQRIYLAPNGTGKADLGSGPNGKPRDPKKSAKAPADGASTAGRSVMFGSAGKAAHVILTEGIETGAAVAHAFRVEIEAGEVAVAAAISAGGVAAWQPWPATKRVTIAADRDEARKPSKTEPTKAGERAAREFGMRRQDERSIIEVHIALPGAPGTATDWLDVLRSDGVEAVRTGIETATRFVPTEAELRGRAEKTGREVELERVAAMYPLPDLDGQTLLYKHARTGRIWLHKEVTTGKGENATSVEIPIASPFSIVARLRMVDAEDSFGLRLVLEDMSRKPRNIDIERGALASMGGTEARRLFLANGTRFEGEGEAVAVAALKAAHPEREIAVTRRAGWHFANDASDPFFICPDGCVIGAEGGQFELTQAARVSPFSARGGTLAGWQAAVSVAAAVPGCEHFTLGIAAGFAGALVSLCGLDTCGLNLSGKTTLGKSTAQRLAASAWSVPDSTRKDSLFQSARATANSLEAVASRANGTTLVLDELGHISGAEVGKLIYMVASGVGKSRMTAAATIRDSYSWSTFALLSAEVSLEEKMRADGEVMKGGQVARFPDIDITGVNGQVSPNTMAKISEVRQHFGHAGPSFIEAMIRTGKHLIAADLKTTVDTIAGRLARRGLINVEPQAAMIRAAMPFAILYVAGGLARDLEVLPKSVDVGGAVTWAWDRFKASGEAIALDPETQSILNLTRWIAERWNTSIHSLDADQRPTRDAVGWWDNSAVYIPDNRLCEAAGGALKESQVAKILNEGGFIAKRKSDKHTCVSYVPRVGPVKAYALSRRHFGRQAESVDGLQVHDGGRL